MVSQNSRRLQSANRSFSAPLPAPHDIAAPACYAKPILSLLAEKHVRYQHLTEWLARRTTQTIPLSELLGLFLESQEILRIPSTALTIGQRLPVTAHGHLGLALLSAATLEDAITAFVEHVRRYTPWLGVSRMNSATQGTVITVSPTLTCTPYERPVMELILSTMMRSLTDILGTAPTTGVQLEVSWPAPAHRHAYGDCLPFDVRFAQSANRLFIDAALLAQRLPLANPQSHEEALARLRRQQVQAETPWCDLVNRWLINSPSTPPTLTLAASSLGLSARQLRERLYQEGSSFRQLLAGARLHRAKQMLATTQLPISQIAEQCGFKELSSFSRTFRRHHGCSPRQFRQAANSADADSARA